MTDYTIEALQEQRKKLLERVKVLDKKIAEKQKRKAEREAKAQAKKEQEVGKILLNSELKNWDLEKIKKMVEETIDKVQQEKKLEKFLQNDEE